MSLHGLRTIHAGFRTVHVLAACLAFLLLPAAVAAQQDPGAAAAARFDVRNVMIPMRDGVRLYTRVFTPRQSTERLPIIMKRTPYGADRAENDFTAYMKELVEEGYIFVFQDIRGRYKSEGTFDMMRPACPEGAAGCIDEGTDTFDTIEWLLRNVPGHNGRVGMLGISYDGWTTMQAALRPHPALRAISPQAPPADMWLGDDFHHNGAFRLSYGFEYAARMETTKQQTPFAFDEYDTFEWYLRLGPLSNVNAKYLHGAIPTWNDYVEHPDYDAFWQAQTLIPHIRGVHVPTLNVAGWWDQEDFYGPLRIYEVLEQFDTAGINYFVAGPWNHGGWARGTGDRLGPIPFGSATSEYFREQVQAPWFAYWLKDRGTLDLPEALTFQVGTNVWRRWDSWPPRAGVELRNLYFHAGERLSFDAPAEDGPDAFDAYISDPANPVPYRPRPIPPTYFPGGSGWSEWLVGDQRFADDRPDVVTWETEPLEEDVTLAGSIVAHLFASTTGTDADWIVKLIDVHPGHYPEDWKLAGYQLMVANEVFRGRYRNSFEKPEPIPADSVIEYTIDLHSQNYTFRKGHRIMVQVQSTWFPLIDRNPQTFVPNIFEAKKSDFRPATHRIHRSARHPSHLTLPIVVERRAGQ